RFFLAVWIRKLRYSFSLPITAWNNWTDLPIQLPHCLDAHIQRCAFPIRLRLPITRTVTRWCRTIHLLTIAYAFRPRLRSRLTLSGRAFLTKPSAFGERDSHSFLATHTGILTSRPSTTPHGLASKPLERSPTILLIEHSAASVIRLPPVHFRRKVT